MRAMVFTAPGQPLEYRDLPVPTPQPEEVLIRVEACAVCRTDLHIIDGELPAPNLPLVPGHQIVGTIERLGERVTRWTVGQRVGVPWLGWTCGECRFCRDGRENLCDQAQFTGYTRPGGFAEYTVADQRFCFALPTDYDATAVAPLLCAGLIGYRALRLAGTGERLGIYGFGAAAHLMTQVARWQGREVFAFTRPGDTEGQRFARELGAVWAGSSTELPPVPLDAAIIFAPVGDLVPYALRAVEKGGVVVCGGIHMSQIPAFAYELLWGERVLRSVANLTREDGEAFLQIAPQIPVRTTVQTFPLTELNTALNALRQGKLQGAAVIQIS
ncbi:MAG TPA: zinc-binding alcohol dehydrogenase family protein [Chloroflexus aurantiacus]|jgi:propanol-preferring alcohol dehydrogenase|uniref:alcohol dehydrogenase n=1 Tax=Chloroflexus aurantiacus (strain ATCC 29366 / DSM 635 / J-10-fl) TaxID=324602 RepID=A9WGF8_CHLAA|nr:MULTISPECIES: zinc-dependent alcohol dehydrogenase family protein [Chloroflexus]ABY35490.1 zinc-binding alcohol dehydrogenase family protein [Chloroflexus aurantiacus J-10-fl]RMG50970.1 MAG: zinc-binding alcohol dehydrogenase family protein [Chloroflexota bacterium]GIV92071.1 MAG: alcohol dehydrogenase [Chloroflexus sp.]HBW68677.1 zinc-binding alcohol dehydrogenase family protein [Chloroflexus aurantiacus]